MNSYRIGKDKLLLYQVANRRTYSFYWRGARKNWNVDWKDIAGQFKSNYAPISAEASCLILSIALAYSWLDDSSNAKEYSIEYATYCFNARTNGTYFSAPDAYSDANPDATSDANLDANSDATTNATSDTALDTVLNSLDTSNTDHHSLTTSDAN